MKTYSNVLLLLVFGGSVSRQIPGGVFLVGEHSGQIPGGAYVSK